MPAEDLNRLQIAVIEWLGRHDRPGPHSAPKRALDRSLTWIWKRTHRGSL